MLLKRLNKNNKGSAVLEAAIIFPVIFLIIISILFSSLKYYQIICIQSIANNAAVSCNRYIINKNTNMDTGYVEKNKLLESDGYWRIIDMNKKAKQEQIKEHVKKKLKDKRLVFININNISACIERLGISKKLSITIKGHGQFPQLLNNFISRKSNIIVEDKGELLLYRDIVENLINGDYNEKDE